jgi:pyridoxal phosphate enzyme (YggS family)
VIDPVAVAERVAAVHARIAAAGGRDVTLVAVTKGFGRDAVDAALAAGCADIGENYAQETVAKLTPLPAGAHLHFIGHLQSNKVAMLAPLVSLWQTVDRLSIGRAVAKRAPGARVLVQVNVSAEPQKGGCAPGETAGLVASLRDDGLAVEGLMTIGRAGSPDDARAGFRVLRGLCDELALRVCSMGMSEDLDVAVAEGATMVRVGSALFGPRPDRTAPAN